MNTHPHYRGRFAPSPTGPLHFGSLVAAVGSYLDARAQGGCWLVRIEDIDTPRVVAGAADDMLRTLEALGMHWDEWVMMQSTRNDAYRAALEKLQTQGALYPCACTRREIADSALHGIEGFVYPGTCRNGLPANRAPRATRMRTQGVQITFDDAIQGVIAQNVEHNIGDFVVYRADSVVAYQLAVVVDDAAQGITDIVRGADLLDSTPRQIYLQQRLGLPATRYAHLPVAVNERGEKLSKQTQARAIDTRQPAREIAAALLFLGQTLPDALRQAASTSTADAAVVADIWHWAKTHWQRGRVAARRTIPAAR